VSPQHYTLPLDTQVGSHITHLIAGWVVSIEMVLIFCERRKFLASDSKHTTECPVRSLVSILT